MDGFVVTQLLYVAVELGIPSALGGRALTGAEVAAEVGADPQAVTRVLRGLALEGVVTEDDGRFALTPLGEALGPLGGAVRVRGQVYFHGAEGLLEAVRGGGAAFDRVYGRSFFAHLDADPAADAAFGASMASRGQQEAEDVVAAYDFTGIGHLVDVGGGSGVLLERILDATSGLEATLLDREGPVAEARRRLAARAECVVGDFFTAVPAGADAYLLSRVLHDFGDTDAGRILATCRAAMTPGSRLLVVEALLPTRAVDRPAAIRMDLHMLLLFGTAERTAEQFGALLTDAGFDLRRIVPTRSPAGLSVLEAVSASPPPGP